MHKLYLLALSLTFSLPAAFAQQHVAQHQEAPYAPGEVLIQLRPGYTIEQVTRAFPAGIQLKAVKEISRNLHMWKLSFDVTAISHTAILAQLRNLKPVRSAQNNHYIKERTTVPNDTDFGSQWHHVNTGGGGGTADADIDSDEAWDITTGGLTAQGDTIVVALVEGGGANYNHPDLIDNFWRNYQEIEGNGVDDDGNGYIDDFNGWNVGAGNDNHSLGGHGTQCFGMIAASGDNSLGVVGANWNCKVMLVSGFSVSESDVINAYDYPLTMRTLYNNTNGAQGAFVVATSSSWGIDNADPADFPLWCAFYDAMGAEGILSPASTTNNNSNVDVVGDMPTGCSSDYMLSITRTGNADNQAGGYGATTVDFGAPGINVYTTSGTNTYTTTTGTSFSCPLTAGVIALMYSVPCASFINMVKADPQGGADYVRQALMDNVDPVPSMAGISVTGGRLNSFKAVNAILTGCSTSSCPQPFGLTLSNITTTSVDLNWTDGGTSSGFYYYYRPVGATTWDSVAVGTDSATITGLSSCTDYEVMVAADCGSELSNYTPVITFTTDGCCTAPTGVTVTVLTDSTASVGFTPVTAAVSYNLRYKPLSSGTWTTISITSVPHTLTGLTPCEDYEVQVQTVCSSFTTAFTSSVVFHVTGCGACEDLSYCASEGGSTDDEFIARVQLSDLDRMSGEDDGYIFTGMNASLLRNGAYSITVTPGYTGTAYNEYISVWIDYDQDGVFADPGERAFTTGGGVTSAATGTFTVPLTAAMGLTRMRVSMKYYSPFFDPDAPAPCLMFDYGEVEDYCVSIDGTVAVPGQGQNDVMCLVYPNPASSGISFSIYNYAGFEGGNNTILLYNSVGSLVKTIPVSGKTTSIDLSGMGNGIYSYVIELSGKTSKSGRFIVSK